MHSDYRTTTRNDAPAEPPDLATWHPVLRPMRVVVERMHARNDPRAWAIHVVLAICAGHAAFDDRGRRARGA
jgi:hypothetical protein